MKQTDHAIVLRLSSQDWVEVELLVYSLLKRSAPFEDDRTYEENFAMLFAGIDIEVLGRWDPYVEVPKERAEHDQREAEEHRQLKEAVLREIESMNNVEVDD